MTDVSETLLELNALEVDCIIGDLPFERTHPQRLVIDISLKISSKSFFSDELSDTVDYASLTTVVRERLIEAKCRMIEHAAHVVAEACIGSPHVFAARVKVTKAGAIEHLSSASAIVSLVKH